MNVNKNNGRIFTYSLTKIEIRKDTAKEREKQQDDVEAKMLCSRRVNCPPPDWIVTSIVTSPSITSIDVSGLYNHKNRDSRVPGTVIGMCAWNHSNGQERRVQLEYNRTTTTKSVPEGLSHDIVFTLHWTFRISVRKSKRDSSIIIKWNMLVATS